MHWGPNPVAPDHGIIRSLFFGFRALHDSDPAELQVFELPFSVMRGNPASLKGALMLGTCLANLAIGTKT
jgi:hypothetical protein